MLPLLLVRKFLEEKEQADESHGDAAVGKIEHGGEEVLAAEDREPVGQQEQREVEHIHHTAVKDGRIAENHAVKKGVNDISHCTGQHHRRQDDRARAELPFLNAAENIVGEKADNADTEQGKQQLSDILAETDTECNSFILNKMKKKPIPNDGNGFSGCHIRSDQNLDNLVNNNCHNNNDNCRER